MFNRERWAKGLKMAVGASSERSSGQKSGERPPFRYAVGASRSMAGF